MLSNGFFCRSTGRLVTPIDVYILRLYAAELNTTTSIYVFSPFQLKAAITATNVKASQTTATVDITFGVLCFRSVSCDQAAWPGFPDMFQQYCRAHNGLMYAVIAVNPLSKIGSDVHTPVYVQYFSGMGKCMLNTHIYTHRTWYVQGVVYIG